MNRGREFTIRRADGKPLLGEYSFMLCDDLDDWETAEVEQEYNEYPVEYVIEQWTKVAEATKTFGVPEPDEEE